MSEMMIDRVAKALHAVSAEPEHGETWEAMGEAWRENHRQHARAALGALREPDRTMLKAMAKAMSPERRPTPEHVSCSEKHRIRFAAAIDAVLASAGDARSAETLGSARQGEHATADRPGRHEGRPPP